MKKRVVSCALALVLALGCAIPAGAYEVPANYDETYYATLDYYGVPTEASVVKSYALGDQTTITDYGVYDEVVNLTDTTQPVIDGNKLVFTPQAGTAKFYFEGKTTQPFDALPWRIAVSYRLNGAPAKAEDLAGRTGLVEMDVDVLPNPQADEYRRQNLVLTVATAFNDDDITSLEAPGAEVQLIGNLRAVLFAVLPGEEQHLAIRVGAESFESAGLVFLAVPATLEQVERVADLREAKEEAEDSLEAMDASLDVILNTLEGMSGSLSATANGLDRLDAARGTVSERKDDIYAATDGLQELDSARATLSAGRDELSAKTDAALASLAALSGSLAALDRYAAVAAQGVDDAVAALNGLNDALQDLGPHLDTTRALVVKLQGDTKNLSGLLTDAEEYNDQAAQLADDLAWSLEYLEEDLEYLQTDLEKLERALRLTTGVSVLTESDLLSLLSAEEQAQMEEVLTLHGQYEDYLSANGLSASQLSFQDFIIAGAYRQFCEETVADAVAANAPAAVEQAVAAQTQAAGRELTQEEIAAIQAQVVETVTAAAEAQLPTLEQFTQAAAAQSYVQQAQAAAEAYDQFDAQFAVVNTANEKIKEVNTVLTNLTGPSGKVVGDLADLCRETTATGLAGDLTETADLLRDLLKSLKAHDGDGQALLGHMDEAGDLLSALTENGDQLLAKLDDLTGLLNAYQSDVQSAITDVAATSAALQTTLDATAGALGTAKGVLGAAGDDLDAGTEQTLKGLTSASDALRASGDDLDSGTQMALAGLAAALRKATSGLNQTGVIRGAKDTVHDLAADQWDQHSGEVDTLLMIDAQAAPVSMTSSRNPAPRSVQYIMRTQEIKLDDAADQEEEAAQEAPERTFWQRVGDLFVGIWHDIVSLFIGGKD